MTLFDSLPVWHWSTNNVNVFPTIFPFLFITSPSLAFKNAMQNSSCASKKKKKKKRSLSIIAFLSDTVRYISSCKVSDNICYWQIRMGCYLFLCQRSHFCLKQRPRTEFKFVLLYEFCVCFLEVQIIWKNCFLEHAEIPQSTSRN